MIRITYAIDTGFVILIGVAIYVVMSGDFFEKLIDILKNE